MAWAYKNVRKLEKVDPDDSAVERTFGNFWHALRAGNAIDRGRALGSIRSVPEELTLADDYPALVVNPETPEQAANAENVPLVAPRVMAKAKHYWATLSEYHKDQWKERIGGSLPDRLAYVDARWHERWADEIATEEPLAVEYRWTADLPDIAGQPPTNTTLAGIIDEIYFDRKRGIVIARDAKSHKTLAGATSADDMMESQLQIYSWGANSKVKEWGHGQIRAVAYDRVRMVAPKQPSVTASGGLSKSVSDYDVHTYTTWAAGPDGEGVPWGEDGVYFKTGKRAGEPKFGRYEADEKVIAGMQQPDEQAKWFQRTRTPLNRNVITTHLRSAVDSALDMERTRARMAETGDAARNFGKTCTWCDFSDLCRAEMMGGPGDYDLPSMRLRIRPKRERKSPTASA